MKYRGNTVIRRTVPIVVTLVLTAACGGSHEASPIAPTHTTSSAPAALGISAVAASPVADSTATITWTTDRPTDSRVEYGPTEQYGSVMDGAPAHVTGHVVTIGGLAAATSYHFRVRATDQAGTVSTSTNYTFTTLSAGNGTGDGGGGGNEGELSVAITSPATNATVVGAITVTAAVAGSARVAAVQFRLDGTDLGSEDTRPPYTVRWNTSQTADGRHAISAVVRTDSGDTTTAASVRITVKNSAGPAPENPATPTPSPSPGSSTPPPAPPAPPSSGSNSTWPGEPDGFHVLSDQSWNSLTGSGWNYKRRQSSKNADIVSDSSAPESAASVLRMIFTTDMDRDSEPGVHWMGLPSRPREIFTGWWMKLSSNWQPSPAGGSKITFLWATNGQGQVYANVGGSGAPHRININTEWGPYGQKFWEPNVTTTQVSYNKWYRVEWYVRWESHPGAGDGIMRWWVNGVLNGDHRNVRFPDSAGFEQFEFAPTLQNPPSSEQYMYIDHTYVSSR